MEISITIQEPDVDYTKEELRNWIYYELGYSGCIDMGNPLVKFDIEITDINY